MMPPRVLISAAFAILAAAAGAYTTRGLTAVAGGPGRLVLGFSADTLKEERWQRDRDSFVAAAKDLGADVLVQAANSDDARQLRDVEGLISRKVGAIVMVPHNGAAMAKAVEMAHQAGIPLVAYDRLITGADLDFFVAFDAVKIGRAQAQFLADKVKPGAPPMTVVRIYGAKTDHNSFLLKQGQDEVLKPLLARGAIKVVHEDWTQDWKPENAKKIANAAITNQGKFDAVLASNDGTAGGAIQALMEEGLAGKVLVTGGDAELAACQRIVAGTQSMTIYQPIKALAGRAAWTASRLAQGRPVVATSTTKNGKTDVPTYIIDTVTLTKDNVDMVIEAGVHKRADVYKK